MVLPALNPPMIPPMSGAPAPPGPPMPGMMMGPQPPIPPMPGGIVGPMAPEPAGIPFAAAPPMHPLMAILMDPDLLRQLLGPQALPLEREKWQEPPKPTAGQMLAKADEDQTFLSVLNARFDDHLARITGEAKGVFPDHDEDAEQLWHDPAIVQDDKAISAILGTIPPAFECPVRRAADEDEAQAKEDFLAYLHDEHARQHAIEGFGDLDIEAVKTVTRYGRLVTASTCRFKARPGEAPFSMRMIDPSVIYPTFMGDRGMVQATLVYYQRVGDFIGRHDEDGSIEKKLLGTKNTKRNRMYRYDDEIEVTEYWDCRWFGLFAAGELVKGPVEHNYGEPPFVYTIAAFGEPTYTRRPDTNEYIELNGYSVTPQQADIARRGNSFYYDRFTPHAQKEAVLGKLATVMAMWRDEPIWYQRDTMAGKRPEWSRARGARNEVTEGYTLIPSPDAPLPPTLGPLMAGLNEASARGGLTPAEHGMTPAQTSGYAIAGMSEHGRQKLAPIKRTLERHWAMVGEQRLRFYRDWGHLLGAEGSRGEFEFPRAEIDDVPGAPTTWTLTPEMVDRTGWKTKCRLIDVPDMATLTQMLNAFGLAGQQGLMARETKIELLGLPGSRNPRATARKVDIETLKEMPEYKLASLLKYVRDDLQDPELEGLILMQLQMGMQKRQQEMAGPTQAMPGGGPAGVPGMSMPTQGIPTGRQGGRPPGGPPMDPALQGPPTER